MYNAERTIKRCIESALSQTYQDYEILIINDGSNDRGVEICDFYIKKNDNVRILSFENGGLAFARNMGLQYATGDYIVWLDADDFISPRLLYELDKRFSEDVDAIFYAWETVDENGNVLFDAWRQQQINNLQPQYTGEEALILLCTGQIYNYMWSIAARRECYANIIYPIGRRYEDMAVIYRFLDVQSKVIILDKRLYFYNIGNPQAITANYNLEDAYAELEILNEMNNYFGDRLINWIAVYSMIILTTMTGSLISIKDNSLIYDIKNRIKLEKKKNRYNLRWKNIKQSRYKWKIVLLQLSLLDKIYWLKKKIKYFI